MLAVSFYNDGSTRQRAKWPAGLDTSASVGIKRWRCVHSQGPGPEKGCRQFRRWFPTAIRHCHNELRNSHL